MKIYMARAGYDPKAAIAFWERFSEYNKKQGAGSSSTLIRFLSTHPVDEVRIKELQKLLPEAEADYARSTSSK